jgi:hypothetical protein
MDGEAPLTEEHAIAAQRFEQPLSMLREPRPQRLELRVRSDPEDRPAVLHHEITARCDRDADVCAVDLLLDDHVILQERLGIGGPQHLVDSGRCLGHSPAASAAIAELDAWDEPNFRIARATLADEFPEQADHVFEGLEPSTGAGAIVSVKTMLDRLDDLENGKDRKATRKVDHAALAKLAERGITPEERARLRKLLKIALGAPDTAVTAAEPPAMNDAEQTAAKRALWGWLNEWSEVAKVLIKRRDFLIQLGFAKRKKRAKGAPTGEGEGGG